MIVLQGEEENEEDLIINNYRKAVIPIFFCFSIQEYVPIIQQKKSLKYSFENSIVKINQWVIVSLNFSYLTIKLMMIFEKCTIKFSIFFQVKKATIPS